MLPGISVAQSTDRLTTELCAILGGQDGPYRPLRVKVLLSNRIGRPVSDAEFADLVEALLQQGVVKRARGGPGGTLELLPAPVAGAPEPLQSSPSITDWSLEAALMPFVHDYIGSTFKTTEAGLSAKSRIWVVDTSAGGPTGTGPWSRPDFTLAAVTHHRFTLPPQLDLFAFELKPEMRCDVRSVHEAFAHLRFVHYAYLVWHLPERSSKTEQRQQIKDYCSELGVGLITFENPKAHDTFRVIVDPTRKTPSPEAIDAFLLNRMSGDVCGEIEDFLRK